MSFVISGLAIDQFKPLFGQSDDVLKAKGILRKTADTKSGFPCRITLEDATPGETLLLLNYEHHQTASPYRSSYAIYVNENAEQTRTLHDVLPGALKGRPIALRQFNRDGTLVGASLDTTGNPSAAINNALDDPQTAYIHLHNAMHGCFAAAAYRPN